MSTLKVNDIETTTGGIPTINSQNLIPKVWVCFNGTGTVAIRDSENVSSITDNGTGDYTVNFTTALANTNYAVVGGAGPSTSGTTRTGVLGVRSPSTDQLTGSVRVNTSWNADNGAAANQVDYTYTSVVVLGG